MLPSKYVFLHALPLNSNGKLDRAALPDPPVSTRGPYPTGTEMEQVVAQVWTEVLGHPASLDDNFFDTGGTSLLLIAARTALQKQLNRTVPITWMFECTTVRALARRLDEGVDAPAPNTNAERQRQAFARARRQTRDRQETLAQPETRSRHEEGAAR